MNKNPFEQTPNIDKTSDSTLISEIDVIAETAVVPKSKEDLARLVEVPLLEACQELYDKNIQTIMSSANSTNVKTGTAYIDIEFDTLSDENKEIALGLGESFMMHGSVPVKCIKLIFPITDTTTVGDIKKVSTETVSQFKFQDKIEIDYAERFQQVQQEQQQEQNARDIEELPQYKETLEEWLIELQVLETDPTKNPERLAELKENIPKLEEEVKFREELRDKQK